MKSQLVRQISQSHVPIRWVEHELRHDLVSLLADHVEESIFSMLVVIGLVDVLEVHHHLVA